MSTQSTDSVNSHKSRRGFLVKLGLGVAALAAVSSGLIRAGSKRTSAVSDEFPGPDSIFHPARDPRTDPRRIQQ